MDNESPSIDYSSNAASLALPIDVGDFEVFQAANNELQSTLLDAGSASGDEFEGFGNDDVSGSRVLQTLEKAKHMSVRDFDEVPQECMFCSASATVYNYHGLACSYIENNGATSAWCVTERPWYEYVRCAQ